jgi:hypothetical protein
MTHTVAGAEMVRQQAKAHRRPTVTTTFPFPKVTR